MLYSAVSLVLKDEGFTISTSSKTAVKTAETLVWNGVSSDNKATWDGFAKELLASLNNCFVDVTDLKRFKKQRERMWANFHQVRISHSFRDSWIKFLKITDCEAVPVFYQFVTNALMEQIVKLRYPVLFSSDIDEDEVTLDYEERCAVRYTAGYTIWSLLKKVKCSRNKQKEELNTGYDRKFRGEFA